MTQEEKELLLKDLCGRLPYGIKVTDGLHTITLKVSIDTAPATLAQFIQSENLRYYLRPMSSMTIEEKKELKSATCPKGTGYFDERYLICPMSHFGEYISYDFMSDILNWLNAYHFDYRGLIEKGLALEAPKDMYKTE